MSNIQSADLMRTLPPSLQNDKRMLALAESISGELSKTVQYTDYALIYPRIDELPEELLDMLAYDLHVDWYDYDYSVEEKRQLVKDSVRVHMRLGTKYAVETSLSAIFPDTKIERWFEYGGRPHYYRIVLEGFKDALSAETLDKILSASAQVKRLSAWLDELVIEHEPMTRKLYITPIMGRGHMVTHMPEIEYYEEITHTLRVSAAVHSISLTRLPEIEPPKEMGLLIDKDGLVFLAKDGPFLVEIE